MGNSHTGAVDFTFDGKVYHLRFDINAMCEIEEDFGEGIIKVAQRLDDEGKQKISDIRKVFYRGLSECDDEEKAGAIMTALGVTESVKLIALAFHAAFPQDKGSDKPDEGKTEATT